MSRLKIFFGEQSLVNFRASREQLARWTREAKRRRLSLSDWIRSGCDARLARVKAARKRKKNAAGD